MRSDAVRTADVHAELIAVFQAYRHGTSLPSTVTLDSIGGIMRQELAPVRRDIGDLRAHIAKVDGNVTFLARRVDDNLPRHRFSKFTKDQWRYVLHRRYSGECPCCRHTRILDKNGQPIAGELNCDHCNGRELNDLQDGWPACAKCNHRLGLNDVFKMNSRKRCETFQEDRRDLAGGHEPKRRAGFPARERS